MYKLTISASFYQDLATEGQAIQSCKAFPLRQTLCLKANKRNYYDWSYSAWGKYTEKLSKICSAIADDITDIVGEFSGDMMDEILECAKKHVCVWLPINQSKYIAKEDVNFSAEVMLKWECDD